MNEWPLLLLSCFTCFIVYMSCSFSSMSPRLVLILGLKIGCICKGLMFPETHPVCNSCLILLHTLWSRHIQYVSHWTLPKVTTNIKKRNVFADIYCIIYVQPKTIILHSVQPRQAKRLYYLHCRPCRGSHKYTHTHIHTHVDVCTCICMYACMYACMHMGLGRVAPKS